MSTPLKLVGFVVILALVFGAATVAGSAIGPDREGAAEPSGAGHADDGGDDTPRATDHDNGDDGGQGRGPTIADGGQAAGHTGDAADPVRGLAVSDGGLTLDLARTQLTRGAPSTLRFTIREGREAVRDFEVAHARRMHLIVVRRDGRGFQHLHPRLDARGEWRTPMTLPQAGAYRVFADFRRAARAHTLAADVGVDGSANYRPLPAPATVARTDGYRVELDRDGSALRFDFTRGGRTIEPQRYLGARGHLVALREGDLGFLHVHPTGDAYEVDLERGTRYRLYLQFKHDSRVHTAEFTQ